MPKMTPSEAMAEVLVQEGVTHVSGILGSAFRCATNRRRATWRTPSPE